MLGPTAYRGDRFGAILKHAANRSLYHYWDRVRGERPAPLRQEIEPADIGSILSSTFILEALDDRSYAYRLAGTRLCACFGRELKSENWLDGWSTRDREALATLLRSIVSDAAAAAVCFIAGNGRGQSVPFEIVLLPLVNRGAGYTRILGATLPLDEPYWLGAHPITEMDISDLRLIWPNAPKRFAEPTPEGDAELTLPLRRRRHLALYDGGLPD
jgi:hypothetical protein